MKKNVFKQCLLEKEIGSKKKSIISWIPEEYASEGKIVRLKNKEGYSKNWVIKEVFRFSISLDELDLIERHWKCHRKITDI
ncbi:MAG: hypothetical protein ACOCUI_01895 [bacterium]